VVRRRGGRQERCGQWSAADRLRLHDVLAVVQNCPTLLYFTVHSTLLGGVEVEQSVNEIEFTNKAPKVQAVSQDNGVFEHSRHVQHV